MAGAKFKTIIPTTIDYLKFRTVIINTTKIVKKDIKADFHDFTKDWKTRPVFIDKLKVTRNYIKISITTSNKIFKYVDLGTKPHIIKPKNKKSLRFTIKSDVIFAKIVHHPGYKGAKISEKIRVKWAPLIIDDLNYALQQAMIATGHKI